MADWFRGNRPLRLDGAGHPGRGGRRAGLVLLALRDPAAARLPVLRDGAVRGRPRGPGRPHRGRMVAGSTLFVLGFSVVFVGLGVLSASVSRWFFVNQRTLTIVLGVLAIVLGLAFMGLVRSSSATSGSTGCRRSGWRRRRCSASFRAGLDALHRADPGGHPRPGRQRRRRRGGVLLASTPWASGCRSSSPRWPGGARSALRLGPAALAVGDADRRADAGRGRGAAAQRLVGPGGPVAADHLVDEFQVSV